MGSHRYQVVRERKCGEMWGNVEKKISINFLNTKKNPKYFFQKIFLEFPSGSLPPPPPFFSSRYFLECYNIVQFGRRSTSETMAGDKTPN
jgi:hypothetical protein